MSVIIKQFMKDNMKFLLCFNEFLIFFKLKIGYIYKFTYNIFQAIENDTNFDIENK